MSNNYVVCEECGGKMYTHILDRDPRGDIYCRDCGLIYDEGHRMGTDVNGLVRHLKYIGLSEMEGNIRLNVMLHGLREARLKVAKLEMDL